MRTPVSKESSQNHLRSRGGVTKTKLRRRYANASGRLAFREEVRLVLSLDCNEDRPYKAASQPYGPETSGRLDEAKRKLLFQFLADADGAHAQALAAKLFTEFYPPGKNATTRAGNQTARRLRDALSVERACS